MGTCNFNVITLTSTLEETGPIKPQFFMFFNYGYHKENCFQHTFLPLRGSRTTHWINILYWQKKQHHSLALEWLSMKHDSCWILKLPYQEIRGALVNLSKHLHKTKLHFMLSLLHLDVRTKRSKKNDMLPNTDKVRKLTLLEFEVNVQTWAQFALLKRVRNLLTRLKWNNLT